MRSKDGKHPHIDIPSPEAVKMMRKIEAWYKPLSLLEEVIGLGRNGADSDGAETRAAILILRKEPGLLSRLKGLLNEGRVYNSESKKFASKKQKKLYEPPYGHGGGAYSSDYENFALTWMNLEHILEFYERLLRRV